MMAFSLALGKPKSVQQRETDYIDGPHPQKEHMENTFMV